MTTLTQVIEAFLASREFDAATVSRVGFWADELGDRPLIEITPDEVDEALTNLATRGRLKPLRGQPTQRANKPLAPSTINRYIGQLGSIYRYARRLRLVPRSFIPPTQNVDRAEEAQPDPDRYLRPEEVERILKVARVMDHRWGKLEALIVLAFHTGLRIGNLMELRWEQVDLEARTVSVSRTKNGRPIIAPISEPARNLLMRLPNRRAGTLVFEGKPGRPFNFRRLWGRVCDEAGLPGRNFHQLRHGCGSALASAGVNQSQIMAVMGHRTLTASARYMHHSTSDKRDVVDRVFGRQAA